MKIGEVIRRWRKSSDIGVREAAAQMGISHGTLSRVERDEAMTGDTMAKILAWLFAPSTRNGRGKPKGNK